MEDDLKLMYRASIEFPHKTILQHVVSIFSRPVALCVTFMCVLGSIWLAAEIAIELLGTEIVGYKALFQIVGLSLVLSFLRQVSNYTKECPRGFEQTSQRAQRIANLRPNKWESRLALQLLAERIGPIDRECRRLLDRQAIVASEKRFDFAEYWGWNTSRSQNMQVMIRHTNNLLVREFIPSVVSTSSIPAEPLKILAAVEALERLYLGTVQFERATMSVTPPTGCEKAHSLQLGWAEPVRDAVLQLFRVLEHLRTLDPTSDELHELSISFKSPPSFEAYLEECDKLESRIPELLANRSSGQL